jgi:transcriptional regulator with XRE-family HTH domain
VLRAPKPRPEYPAELRTLGDHIRKRRLDLSLKQVEVAEQLGTSESTINNWERHRSTPETRFYPGTISFLGYNPLPELTTFAERLVYSRKSLGLSQGEVAELIGTDQSSVAGWELGTTKPTAASAARVASALGWSPS